MVDKDRLYPLLSLEMERIKIAFPADITIRIKPRPQHTLGPSAYGAIHPELSGSEGFSCRLGSFPSLPVGVASQEPLKLHRQHLLQYVCPFPLGDSWCFLRNSAQSHVFHAWNVSL